MASPLTILGDDFPSGTYILRMQVSQPLQMAFGRFKKGKLITVPVGNCLYVGSALGKRGSTTLARRLLRHASHSDEGSVHPIQAILLEHFANLGWAKKDLRSQNPKRLRWHVDYLLDCPEVSLSHILLIQSEKRLEADVAQFLAADPQIFVFEKGLGASDAPGKTHLLGLRAGDDWWAELGERLIGQIEAI